MFDVAVDLVQANKDHEFLFAMSEEGYIAGLGVLIHGNDAADDITQDYNLREDILSGESLRKCKQELKKLFKALKASIIQP